MYPSLERPMLKTLVVLAAALVGPAALAPVLAASGGVPTLDASASCHGATEALQDKGQAKNCMDAEARIRKDLVDNWSRYSAASRAQCSSELAHAYHASYVELISCLEMANPTMMRAKSAN